ncbi:Carbohydrate-responsive element-binding protein [Microtus ochrogaster]|uniref:Carbohydrate-responsive element-binding protein n=1 Tax=Microtus ochrogaster TaxID=79684 RepID=A0A8J6GU40_MICOH|nr:Carbohydrate-responsive element-binding protein [Microtus ochrogaster]
MARALADLAVDLQVPRVVPCPDSDSDTDSEDPSLRRSAGGLHRSQVIHSGHFMVSSPHSDSLTRRRDQEGSMGVADFGPRSIDPTLTRLFECLSLAYSSLVIALLASVNSYGNSFSPASRLPAVVLEGNYWKRRIEVVMREYHKWRIYYKKRLRKSSREGDLLAPKQVSVQ